MEQVKVLVLRAAGINCDLETEYAFEAAGAEADRVHINRIIEEPSMLERYQIMVFPGGFSYGDDVAAGRILANQIIHHLFDVVKKFIEDGKLVLGICNGFQVLAKAGILGGGDVGGQSVTITCNDSGKFEDRWVYLQPGESKCVFIEQGKRIYLPIAHGEGKVVYKDANVLETLKSNNNVAFRYVDADGDFGGFPVNPNGSVDSIAGLTDDTGRVLGLMPHPERFVKPTQHPHWTRLEDRGSPDGMTIFDNAVRYVKENF